MAKKEVKHVAQKCNVKGCSKHAEYWFPTDKVSGDFDIKSDTFYLCEYDAMILSEKANYECINFLNPETGRIRSIELAVYSCSEDCRECNS